MRLRIVITALVALALGVGLLGTAAAASQDQQHQEKPGPNTITPIKYLVVIFRQSINGCVRRHAEQPVQLLPSRLPQQTLPRSLNR